MARLPILMYHNISNRFEDSKGLTIAAKKLEEQFEYLKEEGYQTFHFSELEALKKTNKFPKKGVIITFDDVYVNQLEIAYPLLRKYQLKASFFAPFAFIDGTDTWNNGTEKIMSIQQLKVLDTNIVELGLHSFNHNRYDELSQEDIQGDFDKCKLFITENDLNIQKVLAYPYGKFPKIEPSKTEFFNILKANGIAYGLRIGNRVNSFPFKNDYEIKRIDIKGEDTLQRFKLKLRLGKLKLF